MSPPKDNILGPNNGSASKEMESPPGGVIITHFKIMEKQSQQQNGGKNIRANISGPIVADRSCIEDLIKQTPMRFGIGPMLNHKGN